jgi:hypothetical protein
MKHLKKFNESLKEPIDVESDIIEFKEKLGKAYHNFFLKMYVYSPEEEELGKNIFYTKAMNNIEHLIVSNPTMTDDWDVWEVYRTDDYGRNSGTIMNVRAVSKLHAKIKVATIKNNLEILATDYYSASKTSKSDI